ncbi:MAG TPA: TetR/AcrR family transcriptional regulator [Solirubrobacteraceae bacterium]
MQSTSTNGAELAPLYEQLRPLRNGRSREEVTSHQRARLFGAMIETVADRGYDAATVTKLRSLAGVSKRTIYDHFPNKEAYFLATYDLVVYRAVKRVRGAYDADGDWQQRMQRAFRSLLSEVQEQPKAARFALIQAPCAGRGARERTERASRTFQRMICASFSEGPETVTLDPLVAKGLVGGTTSALRLGLAQGRIEPPTEAAEQLLEWVLAYRSNAHTALQPHTFQESGQRPYLTPGYARPEANGIQRDEAKRILTSALRIAASNGYTTLTVAQIVQGAESSDTTFFELFGDCEQCFLAGIDQGACDAQEHVQEACAASSDWATRVHLGVRAFVEYLANNIAFARAVFVESFSLGLAGIDHVTALADRFTSSLMQDAPDTKHQSDLITQAITGAVWEIIRHGVVQQSGQSLDPVVDHATYLILTPMIGAQRAVEVITRERTPERRADRNFLSEPMALTQ